MLILKMRRLHALGLGLLLVIGSVSTASASLLGTPSTSPTATDYVFKSTNADNFNVSD